MIDFIILMQGIAALTLILSICFFWSRGGARRQIHLLFWFSVAFGLFDVAADEYWPASIAFLIGLCSLSTLRMHRVEFPDETVF